MTVRFPLVLVNGYPQEIADTDRVANGGNIPRGPNQPAGAAAGDLWMDTGNNELKIYDGSGWSSVGGAGGGGSTVVSPTAPSQPTDGSMWYDTTNGLLKIYLAATVQWVPAQNNVFIQNNAPSSGFFEGDIWYSPLVNVFSMYIAGTTGAWVPMGSQLSVSDILAFG